MKHENIFILLIIYIIDFIIIFYLIKKKFCYKIARKHPKVEDNFTSLLK